MGQQKQKLIRKVIVAQAFHPQFINMKLIIVTIEKILHEIIARY